MKKHKLPSLPRIAKFLGLAAIAICITSCNPVDPNTELTSVTINNNSEELSKRVTMYGKPFSDNNRSITSKLTMPDVPVPDSVSALSLQLPDGYLRS